VEYRLSSSDKGRVAVTLPKLDALLVNCELYRTHDVWNDSLGVFESHRHVVRASCLSKKFDIVDGIGCSEAETIWIVVTINIIWINCIAAF